MSDRLPGRIKNCRWIYRIRANPGVGEGRHRAAHSGLGAWVGARVASPRGPILRPGHPSLSRRLGIRQRRAPRPRLTTAFPRSPRRGSCGTTAPPHVTALGPGVMSRTARPPRNGPRVPDRALAIEPPGDRLPGSAGAAGGPSRSWHTEPSDHRGFVSNRSSMSRYCRTNARLHCSACAVCSGVSP